MQADADGRPANRNEIANLPARELCCRHSIALPNTGSAAASVMIQTPAGAACFLENALAVCDSIHGGLGLTIPLAKDLPALLPNLAANPSSRPRLFRLLDGWGQGANRPFRPPENPGPQAWRRTHPAGAGAVCAAPHGQALRPAKKIAGTWQDQRLGIVELAAGELLTVPASRISEPRPSADWPLRQPSANACRDLSSLPAAQSSCES